MYMYLFIRQSSRYEGVKGILALIFLKISTEIEEVLVKILNEFLHFSTEIKFRG